MRIIKNQDGKLVTRTQPAIPVFLCDYFFFFFAAFFLAAMFITSDRFMEFHSAPFAVSVLFLTGWLYEEMRGAGNDYFTNTFPVASGCDSWTPTKSSARHKFQLAARAWFQEFLAAPRAQTRAREQRPFMKSRAIKPFAPADITTAAFATLAPDEESGNDDGHEAEA